DMRGGPLDRGRADVKGEGQRPRRVPKRVHAPPPRRPRRRLAGRGGAGREIMVVSGSSGEWGVVSGEKPLPSTTHQTNHRLGGPHACGCLARDRPLPAAGGRRPPPPTPPHARPA